MQELLAPERVVFYDASWQEMGSRSYLQHDISRISRIAPSYLTNPAAASVATKMSWASRRTTTREEDLAYSLLGLFDINMSLIYGEGSKAFFRLQSEIIRSSTDQSIFVWSLYTKVDGIQETGMLAPSLSCFVKSGDIVPKHFQGLPQTPYQMTNHGLQIEFGCVEVSGDSGAFLSRISEPENKKIRKLHCILTEGPGALSSRSSCSPPQLWLVMLPCVRTIQKAQPIALLIYRSHEGRCTRASTRLIMSLRKMMSPGYSNCRFECMSFLVANEKMAGHRQWSLEPKGLAFLEVRPALQRKVRYAQSVHSSPLYFDPEAEHPFAQHSEGAQCVFIVDIKRGPRLVMVSSCLDRNCSVFAASVGQHSQLCSDRALKPLNRLSSYVGTHIVTLGDTDDYVIPYDEQYQILIRTRRVLREAPKFDLVTGFGKWFEKAFSCAVRLDLRTISRAEKPDLAL